MTYNPDDAYFDFTCKCGPTHDDCGADCQCCCHDDEEGTP